MLKTIFKKSGLVACWLLACSAANATGLGGIAVTSNLGQPLRAEVELLSVDKADRSNISAKLATAEAFKSAGLDYPYALPQLKFDIVDRDTEHPRIRISTVQPVNEPFVTLLVEVAWSSGKLLREYTFLLDPVGFNIPAPAAETIAPVAPVVPATPAVTLPGETAVQPVIAPNAPEAGAEPAPAEIAEQPVTQPPAETSVEPAAEQAETAPTEAQPVQDALSKEESLPLDETENALITVVRGDSLSKIALKIKPAEVSLERMLVALYRANTEAFTGRNMNRLQAGKVIRLPSAAEIEAVGQREAKQEYRAQVRDWNIYRQQLAAARAPAVEQGAAQAASGKVTAAVAETAAAPKEPAKEILKLSKGQAPGDKEVAGKSSSEEEDAIAREKALQDAEERNALLEKNVKDLRRLAELKKQQAKTEASVGAASAVAPSGEGKSATAEPAAKPAVPAPMPAPVAEPSFIDELLGDPLWLGVGAAVILLLGGGGFWLSRRRTIKPAKTVMASDAESPTGRIAAPVMPSPETGDFTQAAAAEKTAGQPTDEVDPIAEADLFLSFGRDAQAEEVLKDALSSRPGDLPITLKLLSIYANRKDANAFLTYARQVKDSGDEPAWEQVAAMGRNLEPNNSLYGGTGEAPPGEAVAPASAAEPAVDFDLGFGGQSQRENTPVENAAPSNLLDTMIVETPTQESTTILSAEDIRAAQEAPMDFDVTGTRPPAGSGTADEQMFDVTSTHPGLAASASDQAAAQSLSMDDLVFDVTSTHPSLAAGGKDAAQAAGVESGAEDLIFDVTTTSPGMAALEPSPRPAVEEPLAFDLDIPQDFKQSAPAKNVAPLDIGLGDISLNLDGIGAGEKDGEAGSKDERWQEVATKLDLAKAYQEMGDAAGAREILDEVMRDGDEQQRASAQTMLDQL
ncbi:MAG: FimV/HubP family polar landmark protein [Sideroxydans sp.]